MRRYLRISVASFALAAFAIAPTVVILSADTSIAKSENSKGGSNSGGTKSSSSNSKSGSKGSVNKKSKSSPHKSNGNSGKSTKTGSNQGFKSFGNKLKSGFGLFGAPKKAKQPRRNSVPKTQARTETVKSFDHPSNLGKMNGAINSSPQAKLAHIQNGNFNGPVGIAAAYALAGYNYDIAQADYEEAQTIVQTLGTLAEDYDYVAGYNDAVEALLRLDDENVDPNSEAYLIAAAAANADTYQSAQDAIDAAEAAAIAAGTTIDEEAVREQLATATAVEQPETATLEEAEADLFALYKGDEESLTDSEKEVLIQSINLPTTEQIEEMALSD